MARIIAQPPARARDTAILVLAAGASRRLGRPKQLVGLGGEALVVRAVRRARALRPRWVGVVVGASGARVAAALRGLAVEIVPARRWREGLSASLAAGVRRAPAGARRLLVTTVDQWQLTEADLARLLRAPARRAAAAGYAGRAGVPAVFPRRYWRELTRLRGDRGAREFLERVGAARVALPRAEADLDTPAELALLRAVGRPAGAPRPRDGARAR